MLAEYVGLLLIFGVGLALVAGILAAQLRGADGSAATGGDASPAAPDRGHAVRLYRAAMLFAVFAALAVYLSPWGALLGELGWFGFFAMLLFALPLLVALYYQWMKGALEW